MYTELSFGSRNGAVFDKEQFSSESWNTFLMILTLCHSVQVSKDGGHFAASSPDEKALLEMCKEAGFEFLGEMAEGETRGEVRVKVKGDILKFS